MALAQDIQEAQAFGYSRCAVTSTMCAIESDMYGGGDDDPCEGNDCRAMFYWWGVDVLSRTLTEGCDCTDKCVTEAFACEVIRLLNPGCIECGCGAADEIPTSCEVVVDRTVYQALDASQQDSIPHVAGRQTLIISDTTDAGNDWADHVGDIATDDGAGNYTYWTPEEGLVIHSGANNTAYLAYAGGAGPYFPIISGNYVPNILTLVSQAPQVHALLGRNVLIQASVDGTTWVSLYVGNEDVLASGAFSVAAFQTFTLVRAVYYWAEEDECSQVVDDGTIPLSSCGPDTQVEYAGDAFWYDFFPNTLGARFLIISDIGPSGNPWGAHVGEIAIGDGMGGWTYEVVPAGDVVLADGDDLGGTNELWIENAGAWQPYYPTMAVLIDNGTITISDTGYTALTAYPRNVVVETSTDGGSTWTTVYSGAESGVIGGWSGTAPLNSNAARVTYMGECPREAVINLTVQPYGPFSLHMSLSGSYPSSIQREDLIDIADAWPTTRSFGFYVKGAAVVNMFANGISAYGLTPTLQLAEMSSMRVLMSSSGSDWTLMWYGRIDGVLAYYRSARIIGARTIINDGDWHSIVVTQDGDGRWDNPDVFRVYIDGVSMPIIVDHGADTGDPSVFDGVTWDHGRRLSIYIENTTPGIFDVYVKNAWDGNKTLTPAQITTFIADGSVQYNTGLLGIESFANINYGDTPAGGGPYYVGLTWPVPVTYAPIVGPLTGLVPQVTNAYVTVADVPPQLLIP